MNGMEKEIVEVALDDIIPNRFQPRLSFDEQALNELAQSIRQHGIIQPLVLRKIGNKYEIIAGERRYKASYIAGLTKVPAVIINLNDNESAEVAIVENLQRQDLSAIEEAKSYKKLLDRGYLTQDQLASRMGKTQATVSNKLRLLNLNPKVQEALLNNQISERHARSLLRLERPEDQEDMLNEIISRRLNVRATEEEINNRLNNPGDVKVLGGSDVEALLERAANNEFNRNIEMPAEEIKEEVPVLTGADIEKMDQKEENSQIPFIRPIDPLKEVDEMLSANKVVEDEKEDEAINSPTILPFSSTSGNKTTIIEEKMNKLVKELDDLGFKVKLEEYDFANLYQYVVKIEKND